MKSTLVVFRGTDRKFITDVFEEWTFASFSELTMVLIAGVVVSTAIVLRTRMSGLRSFSKMSAADFAMTVAVGSLFASTISSAKPSLLVGLVSLAILFFGQALVAWSRRVSPLFCNLADNDPILLIHRGEILDEHLCRAKVTRADLCGKLREANAFRFDQVLAVVFETTGDISVIHSNDPHAQMDAQIFENVSGAGNRFDAEGQGHPET